MEQDGLITLAHKHSWGAKFYISGNSRGTDKQWVWGDPYFEQVVFNNRNPGPNQARPGGNGQGKTWDNGMMSNTIPRGDTSQGAHYPSHVLMNGYMGAYAWKIVKGDQAAAFICRKDACSPGYDVLKNICVKGAASTGSSSSDEENYSWVAAPIIIVLLLVGLFVFVKLKYPGLLPTWCGGQRNRVMQSDNALLNDQVRADAILNLPAIRPSQHSIDLPPMKSGSQEGDTQSHASLPAIKPGALPQDDGQAAGQALKAAMALRRGSEQKPPPPHNSVGGRGGRGSTMMAAVAFSQADNNEANDLGGPKSHPFGGGAPLLGGGSGGSVNPISQKGGINQNKPLIPKARGANPLIPVRGKSNNQNNQNSPFGGHGSGGNSSIIPKPGRDGELD